MSRLLLTVDLAERSRRGVLYVLSRDPRISVGKLAGDRLPVMAETVSLTESQDLIEQLQQVPGVRLVDVISVDASDAVESAHDISRRGAARSRRNERPRATDRR